MSNMANANIKNEISVDAEIKQEVLENDNTEKKNSSDAESDDSASYNYEEYRGIALRFALDIEHYLTRCYDIFIKGHSDIEEESINLTEACKMTLRGSINRYKSSDYYSVFLTYARFEDRYERLEAAFKKILLFRANTLSHSEFLRASALYMLAAFDLSATQGFIEAPDIAVDCMAEALTTTQQRQYLFLWTTPEFMAAIEREKMSPTG